MTMICLPMTIPDVPPLTRHRPTFLRVAGPRGCADDDPVMQHRDALVHQYLGLARGIARQYTGRGIETEDLYQVASLALVGVAGRFDPEHGNGFATYASVSIHGTLKRHLRDHAWAVRPPRALHDTYHQVTRATEELTHSLGTTPTVNDIAEHLGIDPQQVHEARHAGSGYTATSLDALGQDRPGGPWHELPGGGDGFDATDLAITLDHVVSALPVRDQELVRLRFTEDLTQREIGDHLGISQMQVSRRLSSLTAQLRTQLTRAA